MRAPGTPEPPKEAPATTQIETPQTAHKDSAGKLTYELDFGFIEQMAERMQANKKNGKYAPFNWQKETDIQSIKQALFRHVMSIMRDDYVDDGRSAGHLEAAACNLMILNYHNKNNK